MANYINDDVNFDNENTRALEAQEPQEKIEVEMEGSLNDFESEPILEYGTEQLCYINRVQALRKIELVKGSNEYEPDTTKETRYFKFFFKIVEPPKKSYLEYRVCTSRTVGNGIIKLCKNNNNSIPLLYCTFEPVEIEVPERDKKTGKLTGNFIKIVVPNIVDFKSASKNDIKALIKMVK